MMELLLHAFWLRSSWSNSEDAGLETSLISAVLNLWMEFNECFFLCPALRHKVPSVLWLIHKCRIRWKYALCPHAVGVSAREVAVIGIINGFYARNETVDKCRFTAGWKSPHIFLFMLHFHVLICTQVLDNSLSTMKHTKFNVQRWWFTRQLDFLTPPL